MTRDLSRLLRPKSIAVIGGGLVGRYVLENCRKLGFAGEIWHVHPTKGDFADIADLPAAPDAVFVGVNRIATIPIVAALSTMGAGGVVCYASGFAEAAQELGDGGDMQAQLLEAAGEMPLIGPNCYGFLNYLDGAGIWPDQQGGQPAECGVAILTQSSNIAINLTMQKRGLPMAYLVTAGNQAQLGLADLGSALLADDRVTALGMHIEGVGDIRAFEALAEQARKLGKPIVALKAGRSEQARAATISHTASLAGSAAGAQALLRRLGIAEVASLSEMLEALKLLHVHGPLASNKIGSMSCSGGEASLMADRAEGRAVIYPTLLETQKAALRDALGPKVALANPLDYHTYIWADADAMGAAYSAMMLGSELALGCVVADFPRADRCSEADWDPVVAGVVAAMEASGKPMAIVASLPETLPEHRAEELIAKGVAPLNGMDEALAAIEAAAFLGRTGAVPAPILLPQVPGETRVLTEAEGKAALRAYGGDVPNAERAQGSGLAEAATRVGFPLVLKGEGIAHKTEAGAVALNLNSAAEVTARAAKMPTDSFLLEEMITGGVAELLIGVTLDEAHGYLLTLAAGGTLTEILKDSASLLLPATDEEITAALQSLKIAPMLAGYRGAAAANMAAILDSVRAVQDYVTAHQGQVAEIEINPLICTPTRAVVADALIRRAP
ncbi:putative Acetyl-CoA synthetase (ADP-forming) [Candidatus Rhodobacter oscarellae]|uniref:Putative Acetyl-CoA synthetase (ADP-forming) n=1 Tax=Candidatus Rhodobacter oscarellae TaxID=1675527 RepID=A0A0J9E661_9RHOB|nr:acetate--CoA ligase family protein [Candidatus Rhodobacter lobularis]KMW57319.1 putative Acetyl-CoA synthetase (ADP-forming) [Candidatus Rhodobacter lobularis]